MNISSVSGIVATWAQRVAKTIKPAHDDKTGLPRLIPLTLGLALLTVATTPAQPPQAVQAPSATTRQFTGRSTSATYITMRDGVRLAADIHLPKGLRPGEKTATVLHMSRYYRSVGWRSAMRFVMGSASMPLTERDLRDEFVQAGYSWIDVDVRGAGASFGHSPYPISADEVRDGTDLIDWIVKQPWSAGVVGALGSSYDGMLASSLARNEHPALKAIVARFSGWDVYRDYIAPGGLQATSTLRGFSDLVSAFDLGKLKNIVGWQGSVLASGVSPVDAKVIPEVMAAHAANVNMWDLLSIVNFRDDHEPGKTLTTEDFSPSAMRGAALNIPVYAYTGWFDGAIARSAVHQFMVNQGRGSRLRLGPWFHGGQFNASLYAGGEASFNHAWELIRFFDYHLRGLDNGFTQQPPVAYYTMGAEQWRTAASWPPATATSTYFLDAGQRLSRVSPLNPPVTSSSTDVYKVDPKASTDTGSRWGLIVGTGLEHRYENQAVRDRTRLVYTSEPLATDVEVTGHPVVRLMMSANWTDGGVFAYLENVRPNGRVWYVTEGQLRLVNRMLGTSPIPGDPVPFHSFLSGDARPMVVNQPTEVVFDLLPTSFVFKRGDRIRLAIAGASDGVFTVPLPASGPLVYTMHRGGTSPSRLDLPVRPSTAPAVR